ncbi:uncharacterized protein LOC128970844 [Indicator indicator]|uniref:uncharacterized protein LOC128970844 n=1 Tax=Indicator indicator TaxID=1002788 RepID=UPI0023DE9E92|nr:uncharacterized protein LOC128970844 [Indicator indicator]
MALTGLKGGGEGGAGEERPPRACTRCAPPSRHRRRSRRLEQPAPRGSTTSLPPLTATGPSPQHHFPPILYRYRSLAAAPLPFHPIPYRHRPLASAPSFPQPLGPSSQPRVAHYPPAPRLSPSTSRSPPLAGPSPQPCVRPVPVCRSGRAIRITRTTVLVLPQPLEKASNMVAPSLGFGEFSAPFGSRPLVVSFSKTV